MSDPVVPPIVPEKDDRLPYEKIEITEDHSLINRRKFQQETDTHTLDLVKEIWE
ncbi:8221_t:CDS:2, partial [Dentiscutata erythropus]